MGLDKFSFLSNIDSDFVDELHQKYLVDKRLVEPSWRQFFDGYEFAKVNYEDETDYVAGLLHNLGKLILAITFPDLFEKSCRNFYKNHLESVKIEKEIIGWDHAKIGAYYLWNHHISDEVVEAVHCHNNPIEAKDSIKLASAIQLADALTHEIGIHGLENIDSPDESYLNLEGWKLLFGDDLEENEIEDLKQKIEYTNERISKVLHGIL